MRAIYHVAVTKQAVGTAIYHREPYLEGKSLIKIMDIETLGESKVVVMECTDFENKLNLSRPGVMELSLEEAQEICAVYRPQHRISQRSTERDGEELIEIPTFDLNDFLSCCKADDRN